MGFEKRAKAKAYVLVEGDTLEKIAQRETENGNAISALDIARLNWGHFDYDPDSFEDRIEDFLRDKLRCTVKGEDGRYVITSSSTASKDLLIPIAFRREGLPTRSKYKLKVTKGEETPSEQFLACVCIEGVTFEFGKSFLRPDKVDVLKELETALQKYPDGQILILGHTDKVGTDEYNKGLSERRAESVYAFVTNDVETWESLYNRESWGLRSIQSILADMGIYDGAIDGDNGPKTKAAVKKFQQDNGLTADGDAGPATRAALFKAFMEGKHDVKLEPENFVKTHFMGCGEFNPVVATEDECETNRRVVFFIFHKDRPPVLPCKLGDLAPCRAQCKDRALGRHNDNFGCALYDSLSRHCDCDGGSIPVFTDYIKYVVKPCDWLAKIAEYFHVDWDQQIYNHPKNAAFKEMRPDPKQIFAGDILYIPILKNDASQPQGDERVVPGKARVMPTFSRRVILS